MNSQLSYTTVQSHRDDLLGHASSTRSSRDSNAAPWLRGARPSIRVPRLRLRAVWGRAAVAFSTVATVATVALVVSLSSSVAATRPPATGHVTPASASPTPLGLVRDPHSHLWTCIRVKPGHNVGR